MPTVDTSLGLQTLDKIKAILSRHFYLLLIIPLFLIAYPLAKPGIPITGDLPYSDTSDYAINRLWLWVEKGSIDGLESLSRFPIIGLWYLLSFVNMDSGLATKIMVILGFLLASYSFYFSFLLFFKSRGNSLGIQLKLSALLGSIFYAYNIWSFNRIHHWYLWIGYALLPLFFISIWLSFKNPKNWKYIISAILLWSLASTTPHMTVFYGIIFVCTFLGITFNKLYNRKKISPRILISPLLIIVLFSLVNMYWIYPYFLSSKTQVPLVNYEVTEESLKLLSREGNYLDTIRIMAYWLNSIVEKPLENSALYPLWLCLSFVVPIIAFSALFLKKLLKYAIIFSSAALIGVFLAMGTESGFDYYNVLLTTPLLSKFIWLFREADKWSFLITFAYSFLIGFVSYKILSVTTKDNLHFNKKTAIAGFYIFFLIFSICVTTYPFYRHHMDVLTPTILPSEFDRLNSFLSGVRADKVYFMPYPMEETNWDKLGRVGSIYQFESVKPSIESSQYDLVTRNYYNHIANSVLDNRTKNIGNLIYPLGTSYLIFHNDTWSRILRTYEPVNIELLKKMYSLTDLKHITDIGFYKLFQISNNNNYTNNDYDKAREVNIPSEMNAALGGLDIYNSLNMIPSFNSIESSILFLDDIHTKNLNKPMTSLDQLISDRSSLYDDILLSFVDDKFITSPFVDTNNYDPSKLWSKSSTRDPDQAEFHSFLGTLGIENWEFDYGKGLVMTKALGQNLSIPVEIQNQNQGRQNQTSNSDFYFFMRYLKNEKGGPLRIYLDKKLISEIDTSDRISNKFVWQKLGSFSLTAGKHILTLENVVGFNAVNMLTFIPVDEMNRLKAETEHLLGDRTQVIYYLEAESNFYNDKVVNPYSDFYLFKNDDSNIHYDSKNSTQSKTIKGSFKVPSKADLMVLKFISKRNESNSGFNDFEIRPGYGKYNIFTSDFETKKTSIPLAKLRQRDWINYDKDITSTSLETASPIHGNVSLRVNANASEKLGWNILSTDYIPIIDKRYYNATLDISARDVKDLHSRVLYFDKEKDEMSGALDFISEAKDGTFQKAFSSSILPPEGAHFLKIQVLTKSDNKRDTSYLLDDVKVDEIDVPNTVFETKFKTLEVDNNDGNMLGAKNINYLLSAHKINATHYMQVTEPLPVKSDHTYNYTATINGDRLTNQSVIATFGSSDNVIENATRYGNNASNGRVLTLGPSSEIGAKLEILKPANYSIALRAKTCETCSFIRLETEGNTQHNLVNGNNVTAPNIITNFSLKDNITGLKWLISNSTYLDQGTHKIKIYSDSQTDLDAVVVYPVGKENSSVHNYGGQNGNLDLFKQVSPPAQISGYEKINPTKYILDIKNATRPYLISFAESYDPLWTAYSNKSENTKNNNFKVNSIPLYGVVNGFYVNKTGDYSLVIQYEPQEWFIRGALVSIISVILISTGIYIIIKRKNMAKLLTIVFHKR